MATNKPAGDKARKGAVKKRSQLTTKTMGKKDLHQEEQSRRTVHGCRIRRASFLKASERNVDDRDAK
jgi:hypothetical protein